MVVFDRQHGSAEVAIEEPGQVGRSLVEQGLGEQAAWDQVLEPQPVGRRTFRAGRPAIEPLVGLRRPWQVQRVLAESWAP